MQKQRDLPTYHGFHGAPTYYSGDGLVQSTTDPCFMEKLKIPNPSDEVMWSETFGNVDKCLGWHCSGPSCAKSTTTKIYNGYEQISYGTGYNKFNPCSHYKKRAVIKPYHVSYRNAAVKGYMSVIRFKKRAFGTYSVPVFAGHNGDVRSAASRAWWTMQPRFEGRISMLNFLYELKDLKGLLREGMHILHNLRNLRGLYDRYKRKLARAGVDPGKSAAEIYLMKEFGIDPLLKDLSDIWSQIGDHVQKVQEQFRDQGERENIRHYSETLHSQSSFSATPNYETIKTGTSSKTVFTATMLYYYDYKMRDASDAFMKYWGLTGSAEALWNMIPFSFLVDYFIKIGKALHTMEVDPNVRMRDYSYCQSLKTVMTSGIHLAKGKKLTHTIYSVDGEPSSEGALITGFEVTRYDRTPTVPNYGTALPQLNNVSDRQLLNMGALLRSFF